MDHENIKARNEQILNDYVAGMSVEAISEKYQLSSYHCYSILRQLDYRKYERTAVKSRSPFPDRNRQIIDEYRNGVSATELTKKYNLSRARVYKILSHSDEYVSHRVSGVLTLRHAKIIERNKKIIADVKTHPDIPITEIASKYNAVVGTKAIFSEQADQMRYQVRRFGQKMATAYSMTQDSKTSGEQAKCLILLASAEKIFYDRLDDAIRSASMFDENEYKAFCKGTISFGDKETAQKKKEIYSGIIDTINKVIHDNERLILRLDSLAYALNQRSAQNPWDTDVVLAMSKLDSVISKTANDIKQDEEISKEVMRRFDALK